MATGGDEVDEPDGSVTATLASGSGYSVSTSQGAATVTVSDDDPPPIPDAPTEAEIIALAEQVRDKYEAVAEDSAHHWDVYCRMGEAVLALRGEKARPATRTLLPGTSSQASRRRRPWETNTRRRSSPRFGTPSGWR